MAFGTKSVGSTESVTASVSIPSVEEGAGTNATDGPIETLDLKSGESTNELLDKLADDLDAEGLGDPAAFIEEDDDADLISNLEEGDDGKPAAATKSTPPSADDESADGDATIEDDGEVATDPETTQELRALEQLYRIPANSLDGFTTVKDAETHLELLSRQAEQYQQQHLASLEPNAVVKPGEKSADATSDKAPVEIDLSVFEEDDPTRLAIEAVLKKNGELESRLTKFDQYLAGVEQARQREAIVTQVNEFNKVVDGLGSVSFGDSSKGLSKTQELLRRNMGLAVASLGQSRIQAGLAADYPTLLEIVKASPEFKTILAKEQLANGSNGKQAPPPGRRPKLGAPGRSRSRKDSSAAAELAYDGPYEDNPSLLQFANERLKQS